MSCSIRSLSSYFCHSTLPTTERHTVWIVANGISLMTCSIWSLSSYFCHSTLPTTERHTVWIVANGISLMACSIWSLSSSSVCSFVAYTCSLKICKGRNQGGLNGRSRRELLITSSSFYPSLIEFAIEKISHIDMKVRRSPVLLEGNLIFILKDIIKKWNHDFQNLCLSRWSSGYHTRH